MTDVIARGRYAVAKGRHRLRTRGRAEPHVVFAIAKTGSSSIAASLHAATGANVFHVHDLEPAVLAQEEATYRWSGRPWRVWDAQQLLRRPPSRSNPWRVVSLVRDPIAQSVSAFFQPAARHGYIDSTTTVTDLHRRFADRLDRVPLQWFETHVEPALGIDVFAHGFDPSAGYRIIATDAVRLLLLRCEDLNAAPRALADLLDRDRPVPVPQLNVGAEKEYGDLYRRFLRSLRPSEAQLERAYTSRLVRHFYAPTEIDQFRARWTIDVSTDAAARRNGDEVPR